MHNIAVVHQAPSSLDMTNDVLVSVLHVPACQVVSSVIEVCDNITVGVVLAPGAFCGVDKWFTNIQPCYSYWSGNAVHAAENCHKFPFICMYGNVK